MRGRQEEGKEGERRKLCGCNLCCVLAQLPVGLFVSLLNSRTRMIGSALLGVSLIAYGVWSRLWHSLWGLQDVTVLYWCCITGSTGLLCETLRDCFSCVQCLSVFLDPYSSAAWKGSILFLLGRRGSQDP